jgi:hypothetical protein
VLSGLVDTRGLRVGLIVSGGKIAIERFVALMSGTDQAEGQGCLTGATY